MKNRYTLPSVIAFSLALAGLLAAAIIKAPVEISGAERRRLAQFPELSAQSLLSGSFMSKFEDYAADQFPLREGFRALKSAAVLGLFFEGDKDGLYVYETSICKFESMNTDSFASAAGKIESIRAQYLGSVPCYFALVPDKGSYTEGYPAFDSNAIEAAMGPMEGIERIDLADALSLSSYYRTDLHWRQEAIAPVAEAIAEAMGAELELSSLSTEALGAFEGAYYGQLALPMEKDGLIVLSGGYISGLRASILDEKTLEFKELPVYNAAALGGVDAYDAFLGGAAPIVVIENPACGSGRELVIFRDSFTSSLAPLLASGFDKITLVDLRYIASPALADYVDLASITDALFIYGPQLLNNSSVLLVR